MRQSKLAPTFFKMLLSSHRPFEQSISLAVMDLLVSNMTTLYFSPRSAIQMKTEETENAFAFKLRYDCHFVSYIDITLALARRYIHEFTAVCGCMCVDAIGPDVQPISWMKGALWILMHLVTHQIISKPFKWQWWLMTFNRVLCTQLPWICIDKQNRHVSCQEISGTTAKYTTSSNGCVLQLMDYFQGIHTYV